MKRGEGLQRRTPLAGGRPLQAKTALARSAGMRRVAEQPCTEPTPTQPRRKTGQHVGEARARALVYARSGHVCECCGQARAAEWHHRQNRSQSGKWLAGNGLHLCKTCHGAVTNTNGRRDEYERNGWIVPSHADPLAVPVLLAAHGWVLLDNVGGVLPSLPGVA